MNRLAWNVVSTGRDAENKETPSCAYGTKHVISVLPTLSATGTLKYNLTVVFPSFSQRLQNIGISETCSETMWRNSLKNIGEHLLRITHDVGSLPTPS